MRAKTWRGILLLALLALLSWQLARRPAETTESPLDKPDIRLNYALYDFSGRLLDHQGKVRLRIASPELRNDAATGIGTVDSPEIHIQQEDDRWYITAETAVISANREIVNLHGSVNLSRHDELTDQTLEITTTDVVLHVTPRTAMTDAAVSMRQQGDRLDAVGMRLDMVNENYELLNEVTAHYETP
jgi:lipopolysaccharide export system protein LptC